MIRIENLSKNFGSNQVLDKLSVSFGAGTVSGIVGENGAGKTTLFRCMAGLEPYQGTISSAFSPLKDHCGLLPTEPWFFPRMTGREYLRLLCQARKKQTGDLDGRNIFGLPLDRYASAYSTGMKKKLALTAILIQENDVFILDEPFNGIDIQSNLVIAEIIRKLKDIGKTVIISSHIFSTLRETCDEIHLLRNGAIGRSVTSGEFGRLESDLREWSIGGSIDKLELK